jgi:hypothetical protein
MISCVPGVLMPKLVLALETVVAVFKFKTIKTDGH